MFPNAPQRYHGVRAPCGGAVDHTTAKYQMKHCARGADNQKTRLSLPDAWYIDHTGPTPIFLVTAVPRALLWQRGEDVGRKPWRLTGALRACWPTDLHHGAKECEELLDLLEENLALGLDCQEILVRPQL